MEDKEIMINNETEQLNTANKKSKKPKAIRNQFLFKKGGYSGDYVLEAFQSAEYTDISAFLSEGKAALERIFG